MSHHDRLCPTNQNDDPNCWFCEHNAKVRADERRAYAELHDKFEETIRADERDDIEESFKRGGGSAWQANLYSMAYERGCADERENFAKRLMLAGIEESAADVPELYMPRAQGKPFWCVCGSNVFRKVGFLAPVTFVCNVCGETYQGRGV